MKNTFLFSIVALTLFACSSETGNYDPADDDKFNMPHTDDDDDNNTTDSDDDMVCTPDEKECKNNIVFKCDNLGRGWGIYDECEEGEECIDGECVPQADDDDDRPDTELAEEGREHQDKQEGGHDHNHIRKSHERGIRHPPHIASCHTDGSPEKNGHECRRDAYHKGDPGTGKELAEDIPSHEIGAQPVSQARSHGR